jgi:regulator of protease activity HflC (stomatin/prohibitin superfamily)
MYMITLPITFCMSFWVLEPRTEALVLNYGVLTEKHSTPGIHNSNCWGREIKMISTAQVSEDLASLKITDSSGNPIIVSAVVTYRFTNPQAALLNVQNPVRFVNTQATTTLKQVLSNHSYEELKRETTSISKELVDFLQPRVNVAGATISSFSLNELNYAPEIAQAMLKKQAAQAMIDARQLIVRGAVDIAMNAIEELKSKGLSMDDHDKFELVSNLLVVTAGDKDATPTLGL